MKGNSKNSKLFLIGVLGFLSAFGPFVLDFYLPAFPSLKLYFHTSSSMIQLSLTSGLLGLGLGQLLIGALSDKYGRRSVLLLTLLVFIGASLVCLQANSIFLFILFRFLQGIAGSGGVVISKSVAADLYKDRELTEFFSLLMVINGLSPIIAPILGGILMKYTDWQGIFKTLTVLGFLLLLLCFFLKETLPINRRMKTPYFYSLKGYGHLIKKRRFLLFILIQAAAMGAMFAYVASSPFLLQKHFHLSPIKYSLCFGWNAIGLTIGGLYISKLSERDGLKRGAIGIAFFSVILMIIFLLGRNILWVEATLFFLMVAIGMILPTSASLALNLEREQSGMASALLGFLSFLMGSIVSPLTGLGNLIFSTASIIMVCSIACLILVRQACRIIPKAEKGH